MKMIECDENFSDQMKLISVDEKMIKLDEHMIDCHSYTIWLLIIILDNWLLYLIIDYHICLLIIDYYIWLLITILFDYYTIVLFFIICVLKEGQNDMSGQSLMDQSPSKGKLSTPNQPKRTYNKASSLIKKQQRLLLQQQASVQQQLEQQLKLQMASQMTSQEKFAAAVAAASHLQLAGLLEMQQMQQMQQMLALQHQIAQSPVPLAPGSSKKLASGAPVRDGEFSVNSDFIVGLRDV